MKNVPSSETLDNHNGYNYHRVRRGTGCRPKCWPMCPKFITARFSTSLRLSLVGLCVVAHLATTIGFPLPKAAEIETSSKPFPCQHHHCGCNSAEQCWQSCCCMSMPEKVAWAKEHGVTPPDYVVAAAAEETEHEEPGSCCDHSKGEVASCCAGHDEHPTPGCCSSEHGSTTAEKGRQAGEARKDGTEWVIGVHAQKCQGLSLIWVTSGAVLPPPARVEPSTQSSPPAWYVPAAACFWQSISLGLDLPPPRLS